MPIEETAFMATVLDAPKGPNPARLEDFVEKQLQAARRRVRVLDFFMAGLTLAVGSLAILLAVLLVDRYVETPPGTGWVALAGYLGLAGAYLYWALFRPDRRQINPYFAARQVEQTVPNAKNSLVTWVDFEEDPSLPGSIRTAIGQKAARDLKGVDLNRAIENRRIIWLVAAAGVFFLASLVVAFLPPTRTELVLEEPTGGDITVFNNKDVSFQVRVKGRVPGPNDPDAVRLRLWYNPDDPDTYEERPMRPAEGERRTFQLVVPAKQVRNGFRYKVLAGNTETADYTVTCKIIPEFTGFEVSYEYPAYLKRAAETSNDPNLLAPYGTVATLTVTTNREVKTGYIEVEGQPRSIDGRLLEGRPDAIQFTVPMEKEGAFRIWFTTPEGDKNQDPARLRLGVIDPRPVFQSFDIAYEYPAYLRFKPMTAAEVRQPEIEGPRGTKVVLTARTTRGVKDARLEIAGQPPIVGVPVEDQPMWVRFTLPPLDRDGTAQVTFTPATAENPSAPRSIPIRVLLDQPPEVQLTKPAEDEVSLPANGTLALEGLATDDHGVNKLTLRMKVIGAAEDRDLKPRPYRGGMSFFRKEDNSWPTRVEYRDNVKLPDLRLEKDPNWRAAGGAVIEYWLEAEDNCAVDGPNRNVSKPKRVRILAPVVKPEDQKQIQQQNQKLDQDQKAHEKQQDAANANEKRDVQQQPPKGAEKPPEGDPQQGDPQQGDPMQGEARPGGQAQPGEGQPTGDPMQDERNQQVQRALEQAERDRKPGDVKPDQRPEPGAQVDPGEGRPEPKADPMGPPPAEDRKPMTDPNAKPPEEGGAGESRAGTVDKTPEEKGAEKGEGEKKPGMTPETPGEDRQSFGGASSEAGQPKPEPKTAEPMPGEPKKDPVDKGTARPEPGKGEPAGPKAADRPEPGAARPEKDVTAGEDKKPSGEPGPKGDTPPKDVAADKPQQRPGAGEERPQPKPDERADAGGARSAPKDQDPDAGEERGPGQPPMGGMDEQARGGSKSGPGSPQDGDSQPNDLDRELGELDREINSSKPKLDDRKQSDVDRLMRNPETREKTREKLDDLERNAKDELTKKKARDARASGERAAQQYDQERPTEENVDELSKKLNSPDERDRREAEQRIKDWEKDAQTKKELEEKTDELKKKDRNAGQRVEDATQKAQQARNQGGMGEQPPKVDEQQLKDIARDLNGSDEKAKQDARQKLDQMMKDPKTAKEAQDKLNEMANKAQGQEKQDLENAAKQAGQMAGKEPPKLDPKALEDAAKKLASGDPKAQQEARDQLKEMTKDPKAAAEAQKQLEEMARNAKTPEDKQALENAARQAAELARKEPPKADPKVDPKALKEAADKLASGDPKARQEAKDQLREMMKDPKAAKEAQDKLNEMAKNATSPEDKKALEDAARQAGEMAKDMAGKEPPRPKPEDLKDLAKKMAGDDPKAKEQAEQAMRDMMQDPKAAEQAKQMLEDMAKDGKNTPQDQKALEDALKKAAEMAKNAPPKPDPKDLKDLAKKLDQMDPKAKEDLRKQMEEAMKDPKVRDEMKKAAEEMARQPKTAEEQRQFNELMNQLGGGFPEYAGTPDPADPRNKLKAAELLLEKFQKNITDEEFGQRLGWTKEQIDQWMKDQQATIEALRKQAEKGDWRTNRDVRSPVGGGLVRPDFEPKDGTDALRGGKAPPPSGYLDPYKRFTGGATDPRR